MDINKVTNAQIRDQIEKACDGLFEDGLAAEDCTMALGWYTDSLGRKAQVQVKVTVDECEWFSEEAMPS